MNAKFVPHSVTLYRFCLLLAVLSSGLLGGGVAAADRFPFIVPGEDASRSATDLSGLSVKPAGADGFVHIKDGHFFAGSYRLRIWGVNLCLGADFPSHEDAEKVAAHLAKLGLNGVRMHHHDTAPAPLGRTGRRQQRNGAAQP